MAIRFIDLCSGIGGFHSGLMATGHYKCVGHSEIDRHAEQADTLEFSLCASIAPDRRPLSECAKRTSLGRRSGNRRRSARSTKFHSVSAVLYDRPGTSDLIWFYEANFYSAARFRPTVLSSRNTPDASRVFPMV